MKTFGTNDIVFARASMLGREIFNVRISGVSSQQALMEAVKGEFGAFMGLASLSIRNLTQGWAHTQYYHA